jgi:hypothetical protein
MIRGLNTTKSLILALAFSLVLPSYISAAVKNIESELEAKVNFKRSSPYTYQGQYSKNGFAWGASTGYYGTTTVGYVRFDLSSIPDNVVSITNVRLKMRQNGGAGDISRDAEMRVFRTDSWSRSSDSSVFGSVYDNSHTVYQYGGADSPLVATISDGSWTSYVGGYTWFATLNSTGRQQVLDAVKGDNKITFVVLPTGYTSSLGQFLYDDSNGSKNPHLEVTYTIPDTTPPSVPSNFRNIPTVGGNQLIWKNPTQSDFHSVRIRFHTSSFPSGTGSNSLLYNGSDITKLHSGLGVNTTRYYSIFARDNTGNWSGKATLQATSLGADDDGDGVPNDKDDEPSDSSKVVAFPAALADKVSKLNAWYDASHTNALYSDGSGVTKWHDFSGNQRHAVISFGQATIPTDTTSFPFTSLNFSSSADEFTLPDGTLPAGNSSYTIMAVLKPHTSGGYYGVLGQGPNTSDGQNIQLSYHSNGTVKSTWRGAQNLTSASSSFASGTSFILTSQYDNTSGNKIFVNYTEVGSDTEMSRNGNATLSKIGRAGNTGTRLKGKLAEVIIFNEALTQRELMEVKDYLKEKWELDTDLDGDGVDGDLDAYPYDSSKHIDVPTRLHAVFSNMRLWLDATKIKGARSVALNETVDFWMDLSRHEKLFTNSDNNAYPVLQTNPSINKPGVYFDGTKFLVGQGEGFSSDIGGDSDVFLVIDSNASSTQTLFDSSHDISSDGYRVRLKSNRVELDVGSSSGGFYSRQNVGNQQNLRLVRIGRDSLMEHFKISTEMESESQSTGGSSPDPLLAYPEIPVTLGANTAGSTKFNGYIHEVLAFNKRLSSSEANDVYIYLARKWGIVLDKLDADGDSVSDLFDELPDDPYRHAIVPTELETVSEDIRLWLDANRVLGAASVSDGDPVSKWFDLSHNKHHLEQLSAGAKPKIKQNDLLNKHQVEFAAGDFLEADLNGINPDLGMSTHMFFVYKNTADLTSGGKRSVLSTFEGVDDEQNGFHVFLDGRNVTMKQGGPSGFSRTISDGGDLRDITVIEIYRSNYDQYYELVINNVDNSSSSGTNDLILSHFDAKLRVGGGARPSDIFTGTMSEILIFDKKLDSSDVANVYTYIRDKWVQPGNIDGDSKLDSEDPLPYDATYIDGRASNEALPVSSGLTLWLDATQPHGVSSSVMVDEANLITWLDLSGKDNHAMQKEVARSPVFDTNILNGNSMVRFDGANDYLNVLNATDLDFSQMSFFTVTKGQSKTKVQFIAGQGRTGDYGYWFGSEGGDRYVFSIGDNADGVSARARKHASNVDQSQLFAGRFDGTINTLHNMSVATHDSKTSTGIDYTYSTEFNVGNIGTDHTDMAADRYLNGHIGEIILYDRKLTDTEMVDLFYYLSEKWGLQAEVDSDGDGLVDLYDAEPKNGSLIKYIAGAGLDWVDPVYRNVSFESGTVNLSGHSGDVGTFTWGADAGETAQLNLSGTLKADTIESGSGSFSINYTGSVVFELQSVNVPFTLGSAELKPHSDQDTITFASGLTASNTSKISLRVTSNSVHDSIDITGDFVADGELAISFNSGYSPVEGDAIQLFNVSGGSISGEFDTITFNGGDAPKYYKWDTSDLHTAGFIKVVKDMTYWVPAGAGTTPGDEILLTNNSGGQRGKSALLTNGNIAHAYGRYSPNTLYFKILDRDGNVVKSETVVANDWSWMDRRSWSIKALPSGKFVVAYSLGSLPLAYAKIYNNDGSVHLSQTRTSSTQGGGNYTVAVSSEGHLYFNIGSNSSANKDRLTKMTQDGTFLINNAHIPNTPDDYTMSLTLPLDDGNLYIIGVDYGGQRKVLVQKFDPDLNQIGSNKFLFPRSSSGLYNHPSATILDNGKVIISSVRQYYDLYVGRMDQNLNIEETKLISNAGHYVEYLSFVQKISDARFILAYEEASTSSAPDYTRYMVMNSGLDNVVGETNARPDGARSVINDLSIAYDGTVMVSYYVSNFLNYGRLFLGDHILDRDADGVADIHDVFPDDPALSAMPSHNLMPPVTNGLELWLDGKHPLGSSTSLSNGDKLTYWIDFSGNMRHLSQLIESDQPRFKTSVIASQPAVDFSMHAISAVSSYAMSNEYSIFMAYDTTGFGTDFEDRERVLLSRGADDGFKISYEDERYLHVRMSTDTSGGYQFDTNLDTFYGSHYFLGLNSDGTNLDILVNGETQNTVAVSPVVYPSGTTLNIGSATRSGGGDSGNKFKGAIGDVLIYNRALTDSEMQEISYFLSTRWELDTIVDSDGDGLKDVNDGKPTDSTTLEYNVGSTFSWIPVDDTKQVNLMAGNVQIIGAVGEVDSVVLGSREGYSSRLDVQGIVSINTLAEGDGLGNLNMQGGMLKLKEAQMDVTFTNGELRPLDNHNLITIGGSLTLNDMSILSIPKGKKLSVVGDIQLDGVLNVEIPNGTALTPGLELDLIDWTGTLTGTFDSISGLPPAEKYYRWETHHITDNGTIKYERDPKYWVYNSGNDSVITFPGYTTHRSAVAVLPEGKVVAFYTKSDKEPYMQIFDRYGETLVSEFRIDSTNYESSFSPELVRLSNGKVAAIYLAHDGDWKLKFAILNPDGTTYKSPTLIGDAKWAIDMQVSARPDSGGFVVTWEKDSGYFVAEYNDEGNAVVSPKAVPTPSGWSKMAPDSSGGAWGTYYVSAYKNYLQRYDANYSKVGGSLHFSANWSFEVHSLEIEPGKVVVAAQRKDGEDVLAAVYDDNLTSLTGHIQVIPSSVYDADIELSKYFDGNVILLKTGMSSPVARTMSVDGSLGELLSWPVEQERPHADFYEDTFASIGQSVYGTFAVLIRTRGWELDRDADGTSDSSDVFPDDPTLQAIPNHSVQPPVTSGLKLWLDGKHPYGDEISLSNGDDITYWIDFSGNAHYFSELEPSKKPSFKNSAIGLQSAVYFDQDSLSINPGIVLGSAYTVFAAYDTSGFGDDNEAGVRTLLSRGQQDGFRLSYIDESKLRLQLSENTSGGFQKDVQLSGYDSGQYFVGIKSSGSNLDMHVNGTSVYTDTTATVAYPTGTSMNIGATETGSGIGDTWEGAIGDILIYDRALSDSEMQEISYFLSSRWELDNVVDSDADGLVDFYDAKPTDNTIIEYNVGTSFAWVHTNDSTSVYLMAGNVQVVGDVVGNTAGSLVLGSRAGYSSRLDVQGVVSINSLSEGPGTGVLNMQNGTLKLKQADMDLAFTGGTLRPKDNESKIQINGTISFAAPSTLAIPKGKKLNVVGDIQLDGDLNVEVPNGTVLTPGLELDLIDWTGTLTGSFDSISGLPPAEKYYRWETHHITDNGKIIYNYDPKYWVDGVLSYDHSNAVKLTDKVTFRNARGKSAILSDGNIVNVYHDANKLYFEIVTKTGASVVAQKKIVDFDYVFHRYFDIEAHPSGGFAVVYKKLSGNAKLFLRRYNNDGTGNGSEVNIHNNGGGLVHIKVNTLGQYIILNSGFSSSVDVHVNIYSSTGSSILGPKSIGESSNMDYPTLLPLPDGRYFVAGNRYSDNKTVAYFFDSNFDLESTVTLSGGTTYYDSAMMDSDTIVLIGNSKRVTFINVSGEVEAAKTLSGLGSNTQVPLQFVLPVGGDNFMVAYQEDNAVKYQVLNTAFDTVKSETSIWSGGVHYINGLVKGPNGEVLLEFYDDDGGNLGNWAVLFNTGKALDRDVDGSADLLDSFPDDTTLQSMPTFTNDLPITTGLMMWLDASQLHGDTVIADGAAIQTWVDLSGQGNHAQQVTANMRPLYQSFASSGKNGLHFDGSNDFMRLIKPISGQSLEHVAAFVVYKPDNTETQTLVSYDESEYFALTVMNGSSNTVKFSRKGTGIDPAFESLVSGGMSDTTLPHMLAAAHNETGPTHSARAYLKIDGDLAEENSDVSGIALGRSGITRFGTIGAEAVADSLNDTSSGQHFSGEIAEIIVYNKTLLFSEINMIESYLAKKWNLDNDDNTTEDIFPFDPEFRSIPERTTPNIVSDNLVLWYRADKVHGDSTSLSDGDAIKTWVNLASDDYHAFQHDDQKLPKYKLNQFGDKPGVVFDGTNFLEIPHESVSETNTNEFTFIIRLKATSPNDSQWRTPFSNRFANSPGVGFNVYKSITGTWQHWVGGTGGSSGWYKAESPREILADQEYILSVRYDGSSVILREDGLELAKTNISSLTPSHELVSGRIGAMGETILGKFYYKGPIYEILLYNRALTDDEIKSIEADAKDNSVSYDTIWVDSNASGFGYGTADQPFTSFDNAYEVVKEGGTIILKNSSFPSSKTMTKPVNLKSNSGPSTIGR